MCYIRNIKMSVNRKNYFKGTPNSWDLLICTVSMKGNKLCIISDQDIGVLQKAFNKFHISLGSLFKWSISMLMQVLHQISHFTGKENKAR